MPEEQLASETGFLIIDDHAAIIEGMAAALNQAYPDVSIVTTGSVEEAEVQLEKYSPTLIVADLSIPKSIADQLPMPDTGIQLLRTLLERYPTKNFVVQSAHTRTLIRIKPSIDEHQGGFTIVDKRLSMEDILKRIDWALQGLIYTPPEMRMTLEVKADWIKVLRLAFHEGLQDKAIAQAMNIRERTVRHHWTRVQNALGVHPEEGKNIRIQTELVAREKGLID